MTKVVGVGLLLVVATLIALAGVSRSDAGDPTDVEPSSSFPLPPPENTPLTPAPPGTPLPRQPFTLYEPGPPNAVWTAEQLTAEEREVVELGADNSAWAASQDVMVEAVKAEARIQAAIIAQRQLGVGALGDTGVVP